MVSALRNCLRQPEAGESNEAAQEGSHHPLGRLFLSYGHLLTSQEFLNRRHLLGTQGV
jgi:hypothetical protein